MPIDNHIYNCFSTEEWSQDLQGDFESYQDFALKGGLTLFLNGLNHKIKSESSLSNLRYI